MTSKISYSKMVKHSMGQRVWYAALLGLAFFLCFPLMAMLQFSGNVHTVASVQVTNATEILQEMKDSLRAFLAGGNPFAALTVAGGALLAAWTGLSYLHSSRKLDMVHSLPVKKEKIFLVETTASLLLFLIPYAVNLVLANLVGLFWGIYSPDLPLVSLAALAMHLIFFLAVYSFGALSMLLTGKLLTGIIGSGVFLLYLPGLTVLLMELPGVFYETYCGHSQDALTAAGICQYLSPAYSLAALCIRIGRGGLGADFWSYALQAQWWEPLLCSALMGAAVGMLNLWLAKIRPSEGAGRSLVFWRTEGIIKLALLPVLGLAGGLFFRALGDANSAGFRDGWFWFGIIFTVAVCSVFIEVIYHFDRKRLLDHKLCTGIAIFVTVAVGAWFQMDLGGYDTYLPQESRISSMAISYSAWYGLMEDEDGETVDTTDWLEKNGQMEEFSSVYQLARQGVDIVKYGVEENTSGEYDSATIIYQLKNGRKEKRSYRLPVSGMQEVEQELYQREAYRMAIWPVLNVEADNMGISTVQDPGNTVDLHQMGQEERKKLAGIYQKELASMSYQQMQEPPVATITLCRMPGWDPIGGDMPINRYFTETLKFLKARGFEPDPDLDTIKITRITVECYREPEEWADRAAVESVLIAETPEDIERVRENLVWDAGYWLQTSRNKYEKDIFAYVEGINEEGESVSMGFRYPQGKLPEVVKEFYGL